MDKNEKSQQIQVSILGSDDLDPRPNKVCSEIFPNACPLLERDFFLSPLPERDLF